MSEIPLAMQVKLLRFLQEKQFERVGGNETLTVDVRIVAATNRDLKERVSLGRLPRGPLLSPERGAGRRAAPARRASSDIPLLAQHFLRRFAAENGRGTMGFSERGHCAALLSYPWPGNVRELENAIERAVVMCQDAQIGAELLPGTGGEKSNRSVDMLVPGITMAELERMAILQTLEAVGGSTARAAELLDISRRKIQYRLKEWGLTAAFGADTEE